MRSRSIQFIKKGIQKQDALSFSTVLPDKYFYL
jgi:hypothetical protein